MIKIINFIFLLLCLHLISSNTLNAQSGEFRLQGTLIDSLNNRAIEFATISVTEKDAASAYKYTLSDERGAFEINCIPHGEYNVKVEYMGYKVITKEISNSGQRTVRTIDIGRVNMTEDVSMIDQIVVSAQGNPVIMKKDTIEYNASSFKVNESDMLEELLKKMPGIEIDSEGKITSNGKEINKVMIDGKTFFLDDPQLATKNLPASIVDKVRVVDRRSEQAQFTGIDDGNEETVIDLSIRPGMMNGWFGNMTTGYGTEDRYQGVGMIGKFTSNTQISLLANVNNTNNRAFSDLAGNMMGAMRGGGGNMVRVGGATMNLGGTGITTSWMTGLNAHYDTPSEKLEIGGNYMYSGSDRIASGEGTRRTFLADSSFVYNQKSESRQYSDNHRFALELDWDISDKTSIRFTPNVSLTKGFSNDTTEYSTKGYISGIDLLGGGSRTYAESNSQSLGGNMLLRQRFNKVGRTFSVNVSYSYSNNELDGHNNSITTFYDESSSAKKDSIINQKYNVLGDSYSLGARASYTEPLGNNLFLELAYRYNFSWNHSKKDSYNFNEITGLWDIYDDVYSTDFRNTTINQQMELNVTNNGSKFNYVVGVNVMPSYMKSIGGERDIKRHLTNFAPRVRLNYRISDTRNLRINYRGNTRQPTLNQLQPVPDNTNPLLITVGNPDLIPSFTQSVSLDYRDSKRETFRSLNAGIDASITSNSIVNKKWYEDRIEYTMPINENGVYSMSGNVMYNSPIRKSRFYIMTNGRVSFNNGVSYTNAVRNITKVINASENLRFTYRGDKLEMSISGRASYSQSYINNQLSRTATWNNSISSFVSWTLPGGFNLTSDIDHTFYIGYANNEPSTVWNAEISKLLFKNSATLRLKIFDILKQSTNVSMRQTDDYIQETRNNTLRQYIMLSFTYRFGTFGGRGQGGGGGQGHRMNQGPPPGGMRPIRDGFMN